MITVIRHSILYVASPYTHESADLRDWRFRMVCRATAALIKKGWLAYSPIAQTIPLNAHGDVGGKWADWADYDTRFLHKCTAGFAILKLGGWDRSVGVTAELESARKYGFPLYSVDQSSFEITSGI